PLSTLFPYTTLFRSTAHQAVEHDDANVLCLGERVTGPELAVEIARTFLRAQFSDQERHRRRVGKIGAIEAESHFPTEALRHEGRSEEHTSELQSRSD